MGTSNYPGGFAGGVTIRGVPILNSYPGDIFWVDSNGGGNGNKGTFSSPFATIDYAIGRCAANNGDIIMVKAGHSETVTASIAADVAGITIYGLGFGNNRPTITGAATDETIDVTAANVTIKGIKFAALDSGTQAGTRKITVQAAFCTIEECYLECGTSDDNAIYVTFAGDNVKIQNNEFVVTGDGPDTAILLEGATGGNSLTAPVIQGNLFNGMSASNAWDEGTIYSSGVHIQGLVEKNNFVFMSGGVGGVEFVAAATGIMRENFFAGGTLGEMLDPGSYYCMQNFEADAVDEKARVFPTTEAS